MTTQGLIGFRYRERDKLAYNGTNSEPDLLGLKLLHEVKHVHSWDKVKDRVRDLVALPEIRPLDDSTALAETELMRHFPNLEHRIAPRNVHQLYKPLQGSLSPYLGGRLTFMPDASDFIHDSGFCKWAYVVNLDTDQFEVWWGNQQEPDHEDNRYIEDENRYGHEMNQMGYYPCIMMREYSLNDLPNPGLFLSFYSFSGACSHAKKD